MVAAVKLPVDTTVTDMQMAEEMFGAGVTVVSASYTGHAEASGIYSDGLAISPDVVPSDRGVILSTGKASNFTNGAGNANQSDSTGTNWGAQVPGDAQLSEIAGVRTNDAAILEAVFIPDGDVLTMQLVFSSEEYLEYVNAGFNDAVGVWVNGVQATLTVGDGNISIDNINNSTNSDLYRDNPMGDSSYNTEMDGFTVTLTLKAPVNPGVENTIKIGIADAGDSHYDSNLLIVADSVQTSLIADDDEFSVMQGASRTYDLLANDTGPDGATLTITKINGQDVVEGSVVTLSSGQQITVNIDGTITVVGTDDPSSSIFTYEVSDGTNTDVGFVTVNTVPCFARGTRIKTERGEVLVEELRADDKVWTLDNGFQPVRWIGSREVEGIGAFAPVVIEADSFGVHDRIVLSQQHRVLFRGANAELLCGEAEVLVRARHLVNGRNVRLECSGAMVEYFHILCDRHEVLMSNGLETESFHPGAQVLGAMEADTRDEILALFPALAENADAMQVVRCGAKAHEAYLLGKVA